MYSDNTLEEISEFIEEKIRLLKKDQKAPSREYEIGFNSAIELVIQKINSKLKDMNERKEEFERDFENGQFRIDAMTEVDNNEITSDDMAEKIAEQVAGKLE